MATCAAFSVGINSCSFATAVAQSKSSSLGSSTTGLSFIFRRGGQVGLSRNGSLQRNFAIRASSSNGNGNGSSRNGNGKVPTEGALILIRHGESLWNKKNLFTGCVDVPLSQDGVEEALEAGKRIRDIPVDVIFCSALIRAQMTAMLAMTQHGKQKVPTVLHNESDRAIAWSTIFSADTKEETIPVITAWELNERMYGELQGLNKKETADKFGKDQVQIWRRSYDIPPPNGESLEMCAERAVAYFTEKVEPVLQAGKNVLISAHGNSLRAIIMYLDSLTSKEVIELELATGIPMLYVFREGKFIRRGSPIGQSAPGVYALTADLAAYRQELEDLVKGRVLDGLSK
jgi:2,3-bisphosphoglycerate-dependent phosphoglycerate mutase